MPVKVSICIPCYEQTLFLKKNLDSVLEQNYTDYEVIVTDDSQSNLVEELVGTYKGKFGDKLQYTRNVPALGSPANWNASIKKARGEWIKILHHDDWFTSPDSLKKFMDAGEKQPASFIFSSAISFNAAANEQKLHRPPDDFRAELSTDPLILFLGNLIGPPSSVLYRKDLDIYFDERLKWVVDFDFYIRALQKTGVFHFIDEPLITSINHAPHNVTNSCEVPEIELYEYFYLYDRIFPAIRKKDPFRDKLLGFLVKYKIGALEKLHTYYPELKEKKEAGSLLKKAKLRLAYKKIKDTLK